MLWVQRLPLLFRQRNPQQRKRIPFRDTEPPNCLARLPRTTVKFLRRWFFPARVHSCGPGYGHAENRERTRAVSIPCALDWIVGQSSEFLIGGLFRFRPAFKTFKAAVASCMAIRSSLKMLPFSEDRARIAFSAASTRCA